MKELYEQTVSNSEMLEMDSILQYCAPCLQSGVMRENMQRDLLKLNKRLLCKALHLIAETINQIWFTLTLQGSMCSMLSHHVENQA